MAVLWPEWWNWELEFTPHLLKRMIDRGFNESDLRQMLEDARSYRPSESEGRFVLASRYNREIWEIVVEPDACLCRLIVITAYRKDQS